MTTKLTVPQKELLKMAVRDNGKVREYGVLQKTLSILGDAGLIAKDHQFRDPTERSRLAAIRDAGIATAKRILRDTNDWESALRQLQYAEHCQSELDATCWYITDAGREAVK